MQFKKKIIVINVKEITKLKKNNKISDYNLMIHHSFLFMKRYFIVVYFNFKFSIQFKNISIKDTSSKH